MSKLITQLKADHAALSSLLPQIKTLDTESHKKLLSARDALLAHLKSEDSKLYPALQIAAKSNPDLASKLQMFASEMAGITKGVMAFFEKYGTPGSSGIEFAKDFATLTQSLSMRIRREETILYPEYEKLNLD